MKLRQVPVDKIKIPEVRVTSYFTQELYQEFKSSVAAAGIIEPIICVEVGGELFLTDGKNRLVEARERGDKTVPVAVIPGDEKDVYLQNLFLNVMRGKPKIREMRGVLELLYTDYQMGIDTIAEKTGLSQPFIDDLLVISALPDEIVAAFDEERLTKGKALALAKLPDAATQMRLFYQIDGRNIAVKDVQDIVADMLNMIGITPPPPATVVPEAERTLKCDMCTRDFELKWLKSVFLCSECESLLRYSLRELELKTASADSAAKNGVMA